MLDPDRVLQMALALPEDDLLILDLRYGINGNYTYSLAEIARILRITKERARQKYCRAMDRLILALSPETPDQSILGEYLVAAVMRRKTG